MHVHILDNHAHLRTPLHRLSAMLKLFVALVIISTVSLVRLNLLAMLAVCGSIAILLIPVAVVARIPVPFVLYRLILLEPFAVGTALLTLLKPHGASAFFNLTARSTLCLLTMILLTNLTPTADILAALRRLHVPAILLTTIALLVRYLHVLLDESRRMTRARAGRTFTAKRGVAWRNTASVAGQLVIRAQTRASRTYSAMVARGWQ